MQCENVINSLSVIWQLQRECKTNLKCIVVSIEFQFKSRQWSPATKLLYSQRNKHRQSSLTTTKVDTKLALLRGKKVQATLKYNLPCAVAEDTKVAVHRGAAAPLSHRNDQTWTHQQNFDYTYLCESVQATKTSHTHNVQCEDMWPGRQVAAEYNKLTWQLAY